MERLARVLTVCSFVVICWVAHRTLQVRQECVNGASIAYVRFGSGGPGATTGGSTSSPSRVENCRFHGRLEITWNHLDYNQLGDLRKLEAAQPPPEIFPSNEPNLTIELDNNDPHAFELARGGLRLGRAWLDDPIQLQRALTMARVRTELPQSAGNQFQLEVLTDFLLLALTHEDGYGPDQNVLLKRDVKFATAAPSFAEYCRSPFVSLAHHALCTLPEPDSDDLQDRVWGYRPLLAAALWRVYDKLPLAEKLMTLERIRAGAHFPIVSNVRAEDVDSLVQWFDDTLTDHAASLAMTATDAGKEALKRTLKELDVEAPTHWEVTFDLTHTPAWKEIVAQLKTRSHFRNRERALVFTPEGEMALPSGLPVHWAATDVQSQKHVMIACAWPGPHEAVQVRARQVFARQTCGKLAAPFWD